MSTSSLSYISIKFDVSLVCNCATVKVTTQSKEAADLLKSRTTSYPVLKHHIRIDECCLQFLAPEGEHCADEILLALAEIPLKLPISVCR